jgi:hypothetical protein
MSARKHSVTIPCSFCGKPYEQKRPEHSMHADCVREKTRQGATKRAAERAGIKNNENDTEKLRELIRLSQIEKDFVKLRRKQSLYQTLGDQLTQAIKLIPALTTPPPTTRPVDKTLDEEEIWLDVSDCQIGSRGNEEETGGLSSYSYEKFVERLDRWKNAVIKIIKYHPNKSRVLNIAFLGDIIDGSQIFESQLRQIEAGACQQVIWAVEHWCRVINELSAYFEVVNCWGVVGNHARIGKKGVGSIVEDNLEYVLYNWMKDRLASNSRVHWEIPKSYWAVVERMGKRHLIIHGDRGIRGWGGIPFYGIKRYKAAMHELLRTAFDIDAPFDFIHLGHFSQLASFDDCFMNGSYDAGTELSVTEMVSGGLAYQWCLGLHPVYGVSWQRKIHLLDAEHKTPMRLYYGKD